MGTVKKGPSLWYNRNQHVFIEGNKSKTDPIITFSPTQNHKWFKNIYYFSTYRILHFLSFIKKREDGARIISLYEKIVNMIILNILQCLIVLVIRNHLWSKFQQGWDRHDPNLYTSTDIVLHYVVVYVNPRVLFKLLLHFVRFRRYIKTLHGLYEWTLERFLIKMNRIFTNHDRV